MVKGLFFYIVFFIAITHYNLAQTNSSRCIWVKYGITEFIPDSLTIDPLSLKIHSTTPKFPNIDREVELFYDIDANLVSIKYQPQKVENRPDSLLICFDVFPINFSDTLFLKSQEAYRAGAYKVTYQQLDTTQNILPEKKEEILNTPGIRKQGALTRGMRVGNQQDATFHSALNLQLAGKLSDDIEIEAVLSDQEIPFQPEGNTRQIREIDRVYMALKHKYGKLEVGDISLNNSNTHYLKYRKQVIGGSIQVNYEDTLARKKVATKGSIALAKGQFVSTLLNVQEGIMGPYKLFGNNNEPFIIIIAGSEQVFIDGKKLERGLYHDYIIDYNQAEITFNANRLLTAFSRVRIEYEYVTQHYGRLVTQASHRQRTGNMEVSADIYREADLRNNPLTFTLDETSFNALADAGDSINSTIIETQPIELAEFEPNRVLYILKDSIHEGITYPIYQRALNGIAGPYFAPGFIFVGTGKGNYILGSANSNGKEYTWVAPINGRPSGSYAIGNRINAPNLRQMMSIGGKYKTGKNGEVFAEAAFSNHDLNLLSEIHDTDNNGQAIMIGYETQNNALTFSEKYKWHSSFSIERLTKNFRGIDRFRSVEFDRKWGIFSTNTDTLQDLIGKWQVGMKTKDNQHLTYNIAYRKKEDALQGFQHWLSNKQKLGRFSISNDIRFLYAQITSKNRYWSEINSDINYQSKIGISGYKYASNKHNFSLNAIEIRNSRLSNFDAHTFYFKSADTSKIKYDIAYTFRSDEQTLNTDSVLTSYANTLTLSTSKKSRHGRFRFNLNLRELNILNGDTYSQENTLNGQGNWYQKFFKNTLVQEVRFSTGTGRELKRDFVFLPVANGTGTHTWRDNNNNDIQELDEFYEAIMPDERNYAKFFVPSNEFVQVYSSNFYHKISLSTPQTWHQQSGLKHFISKWSINNLFNASYRTNSDGLVQKFLPFLVSIPDENLISGVTTLHSTLFFQRNSHKFGFDIQFKKNDRKQLLSGGYEAGGTEALAVNFRYVSTQQLTHQLTLGQSETYRNSDFLSNQNYNINAWFIKPALSFQPGIKWRFSAHYQYKNKNSLTLTDTQEPDLRGDFHEIAFQIKSNAGKNQQLNFSLNSYRINYNGNENSALGYEMLEGLRNGINHTLRCSLVKKLGNGLQLQATYNGRKSQGRQLIHTGNVQVSALF